MRSEKWLQTRSSRSVSVLFFFPVFILLVAFIFCSSANAAQIAPGYAHTVTLKSDGTVWAWGNNNIGQLGNSTTTSSTVPVQMPGFSNVVSVTSGHYHSVALKSDGTVWAWGDDNYGELGIGTIINGAVAVPVQVSGLSGVTATAAGAIHTVALKSDGTVWAWGWNNYGQIGNGPNSTVPVQVSGLSGVIAIAAGGYHTVVLKSDGTVWALGYNYFGQLGNGTTANSNIPVQVSGLSGVVSISAGYYHTLALKSDGTVWAWGYNLSGQLGSGTATNSTVPAQVSGLSGVISIAAGGDHTVALKSDGTVWACGYNYYGQVGNGTYTDSHFPVQVSGLSSVASIAAGFMHTVALKSDGTVWTWGNNSYGELGNGTYTHSNIPLQIMTIGSNWTAIQSGDMYNVGLKADGTLWAWGDNSSGQLGDGTTTSRTLTAQIGTDNNWVKISALATNSNGTHTLAIKADGTLWAWGDNYYGQLGDNTTISKTTPIQVGTDHDWVAISSGRAHSVALKSDGTLWAWGYNGGGELGDGTTVDKNQPIQIGNDRTWVAISAGEYHTMALKSDGTLWGWGQNYNGELGDGTSNAYTSPTRIGTDNNWVFIKAGNAFTAAIKSDGTLWTWGWNSNGQLGDGTTVDKHIPTQIGNDHNWKSVSTGDWHMLALKSDGTVWAWGQNIYAELGDGTKVEEHSPVQIGLGNDWVTVSAGGYHSLSLQADGSLWAWGSNFSGQLGDGTNMTSLVPEQILYFTITPVAGTNGTLNPSTPSFVCLNKYMTFAVVPNAGYQIASVTGCNGSLNGNNYYIWSVKSDCTVSASFAFSTTYTITATAGNGGSISPSSTNSYAGGGSQTFTITPSAGYSVANVLVDGTSVGAVTSYTFSNISANHTITASFAAINYTITASAGLNGTVTPSGAVSVQSGNNGQFTITPATGYSVADVLVDGTSVGAVTSYTFSNISANHTITASFAAINYTITASAGLNGTITPSGAVSVQAGNNGQFTITPATGYSVADVLVDGSSVGPVTSYTFSNVNGNHTISASFVVAPSQYTITASATGCSFNQPATLSVSAGGTAQFTITPNQGYVVYSVLVDGTQQGAIASYTFTNVQANHTISAYAKPITYTIMASSGANGSISPPGANPVNPGDSMTFAITPASGYSVADVQVDGASVGKVTTYPFTSVTANHTISATFTQNNGLAITVSVSGNGSVTPSADASGNVYVTKGTSQKFIFSPQAGNVVSNVTVDGGLPLGPLTSYTFTNVQAAHTLSVTFAPLTVSVASAAGGSVTVTGTSISSTALSEGASNIFTVNSGDSVALAITADTGHAIRSVIVDGANRGAVATFTLTNVTASHTINVYFK